MEVKSARARASEREREGGRERMNGRARRERMRSATLTRVLETSSYGQAASPMSPLAPSTSLLSCPRVP